jgi:hypothetical protein
VTYSPAPGFTGNASFAYTVADNDGTVSAPATVTVRVNAPPVASDDAATTMVGTAVPIAVLGNDSDADGTLAVGTVAIVAPPATGSASVAPNGVVTYTPPASGTVPASFTYRVADNDGALSNVATVTVTIVANVAPVAADDAIVVATGGTVTVLVGGATSLLANDTDADADPLVVTVAPVVPPQRGALTLATNGTFSYVHDGSAPGYDEFTYQACDGRGGCDTARVAVRIGDLLYRDGFE